VAQNPNPNNPSKAAKNSPLRGTTTKKLLPVTNRNQKGEPRPHAVELVEATREALAAAVAVCGPGVPFRAVGDVIQVLVGGEKAFVLRYGKTMDGWKVGWWRLTH
jgi:methionine aminopeptidase